MNGRPKGRRKPLNVRFIAGFYDGVPGHPEAATRLLWNLFCALQYKSRRDFKRLLARIERDYSQGKGYNGRIGEFVLRAMYERRGGRAE